MVDAVTARPSSHHRFKEFYVNKNLALAAVLLAAVTATSCASRGAKPLPPPPASSSVDSGISTSGTGSSGLGGGSAIGTATPTASAGYDLSARTVYFGYDSSDIDTAGQGVIANYGKYLTSSSAAKVRLEGHTDERGSAEYNIALVERRAQTVARELKALGVTDAQLAIVSYGKERPAVPGSDEAAYAKNRRVEVTQP